MSERPHHGRWFEELTPGLVVAHALTRTVTEADTDRMAHVLYSASQSGGRLSALELGALLAIDAAADVSRPKRWNDMLVAAIADGALRALRPDGANQVRAYRVGHGGGVT